MSMNPPTVTGGSKGPNWMLIGAAGAVGLGLLALLSSKSSGGTTAGATSINAALGSLQEEQMNTQGQIGLLQQSIGLGQGETLVGHIDANQAQTVGALSDISNQVAGVGSQVQANGAAITGVGNQLATTESNLSNQATANQATNAGLLATIQSVLAQIFGQGQQLQAGQQNLQTGQEQLQIGQGQLVANQQQIAAGENQLGQFLNWQFYQLPGRYTATIPDNGSSVINPVTINPIGAAHVQSALNGTF